MHIHARTHNLHAYPHTQFTCLSTDRHTHCTQTIYQDPPTKRKKPTKNEQNPPEMTNDRKSWTTLTVSEHHSLPFPWRLCCGRRFGISCLTASPPPESPSCPPSLLQTHTHTHVCTHTHASRQAHTHAHMDTRTHPCTHTHRSSSSAWWLE